MGMVLSSIAVLLAYLRNHVSYANQPKLSMATIKPWLKYCSHSCAWVSCCDGIMAVGCAMRC